VFAEVSLEGLLLKSALKHTVPLARQPVAQTSVRHVLQAGLSILDDKLLACPNQYRLLFLWTMILKLAAQVATVLLLYGLDVPLTSAGSGSIVHDFAESALPAGVSGVYDNITTDPGVFGRFAEAQLFHATLQDTSFPRNVILNPGSLDRYTLKECKRKDVGSCLYRGEGSPRPSIPIWTDWATI
jgi:hypothetical protein